MASLSSFKEQEKQPVIVYLEDRTLIIDCLFHYNRRALRDKPDPDHNQSYAAIISAGIVEKWCGSYPASAVPESIRSTVWHQTANLDGTADKTEQIGDPSPIDDLLQIEVRIRQLDARQQFVDLLACFRRSWRWGLTAWLTRRRPVKIRVRPMLFMPAHVISPLYRRIWGFLRTGQLESLGLNWSPRHPGKIVIPPYRQVWVIKAVAAHEAGHVFGLGDAYGAIYRFYHEAPATLGYMMNNNQQVQAEEIRMLIQAHLEKRMQFFPRKWNTRRFFSGLASDFRQRGKQMQDNRAASTHSRLSARQEQKNQRRIERR